MNKHKGYLAIVAIAAILLVGFTGVMAGFIFTGSTRSSVDNLKSTQAKFLAQTGLARGTRALLLPTVSSRSSCGSISITDNATLSPPGSFSVTGTTPAGGPATPTVLNGALTSTATTIRVGSTTG